jgi:inosine-uridine nucleoside N-ribohydrolase
VKSNNQVPDAVALYRKTLAAQADKSVTIVTVGFLTNLEGLLNSVPDTYSKLSGKELVKRKVKRLVSMAGGFPMGREYNVFTDVNAAKGAYNQWPTEIIFSGFEIGQKIKTGLPLVQNAAIKNSPVKDVYQISLPRTPEDNKGRMSWDQTAVLVAVRGANPYYNLVPGKIVLLDDGSNKWDNAKTGHFHLTERMNYLDVTRLIDKMMQHQPVKTVSKIKKAKP